LCGFGVCVWGGGADRGRKHSGDALIRHSPGGGGVHVA
jgi:hypothetical protein